jgi:hypothetical protein
MSPLLEEAELDRCNRDEIGRRIEVGDGEPETRLREGGDDERRGYRRHQPGGGPSSLQEASPRKVGAKPLSSRSHALSPSQAVEASCLGCLDFLLPMDALECALAQ